VYYVYAIKSTTRNSIYVGMSGNLEQRIRQHNNGSNKSTKAYRPYTLILSEKFETRGAARKREIYLKSGVGKEYLKKF